MNGVFCSDTGTYLPAPHKRRKEVAFVGYSHECPLVVLYDQEKQPLWYADLVRVILHNEHCVVVETTNSIYVGQPS